MYKPVQVKDNLFYVGVNDRVKHLFENIWPLPKGVSYNSYLFCDEKNVLFDTVDICYCDVFFNKIDAVLQGKKIDYLVVNHMEPDHSGAIEMLMSRYPGIEIIGNNRTADMLKGFYRITENVKVIKDKEEVKIGQNTLRFYLTPMVHWPETMMTYIPEQRMLFSGDAFGTFGALDGGVLDSQVNPDIYWDEMVRYYSNIVGKYGSPVQGALNKLSGVSLDVICSTHGPVWTQPQYIEKVVSVYDKLSKYEAEEGVVIVYGSMYGNTEQLAETIAQAVSENGIRNIAMHNVSKSHESDIIRDIFKYRGLIVGSPTYNNKLYPGIEALLSALENRNMKNRFFGFFSGYTWADGAKKAFLKFAENVDFEIVGESVEMKQSLDKDFAEKARRLGACMAQKLKSGDAVAPQVRPCNSNNH